MAEGVRQSAFAKRRRLNDGTTTPTTDSDASASSKTTKKLKATKGVAAENVAKVAAADRTPHVRKTDIDIDDENTFEPLVVAEAVQFSGVREIEQVDGICKVRLSEGQGCSVSGIARLWVREGSVRLFGAIIKASPLSLTLFAVGSGAPTSIQAQSKSAEFQLESISIAQEGTPSALNLPRKLTRAAQMGELSFRVLGQDDSTEQQQDLIDFTSFDRIDLGTEPGRGPRIILSGKRSQDTSLAIVALTNHLLSVIDATRTSLGGGGVVVIDLDPESPAFACPGTVSIARLQHIILGPSYARPLRSKATSADDLLEAFYVGNDSIDPGILIPIIVEKMMKKWKSLERLPWVIRTGAWLPTASVQDLTRLRKTISPTHVLSVGRLRASAIYEAAAILAQDSSINFQHLSFSAPSSASALSEHCAALQSHFRLHGYIDDSALWYSSNVPELSRRRLELPLRRNLEGIDFVMLRGGVIRSQDVCDALQGALVSIVSVNSAHTKEPPGADWSVIRSFEADEEVHHMGLGYVESVDELKSTISFNTSVTRLQLQGYSSQGLQIGVVLEKPGSDGRFARQLLFA